MDNACIARAFQIVAVSLAFAFLSAVVTGAIR